MALAHSSHFMPEEMRNRKKRVMGRKKEEYASPGGTSEK
jgi:hypothetical protein